MSEAFKQFDKKQDDLFFRKTREFVNDNIIAELVNENVSYNVNVDTKERIINFYIYDPIEQISSIVIEFKIEGFTITKIDDVFESFLEELHPTEYGFLTELFGDKINNYGYENDGEFHENYEKLLQILYILL